MPLEASCHAAAEPAFHHPALCPGVDGKDQGTIFRNLFQRCPNLAKRRQVVHVEGRWRVTSPYGPVKSTRDLPVRWSSCGIGWRFARGRNRCEGVNHHIADQIDSLLRPAFAEQVFHAAGLRDEKKIRQGIGKNAIDLFRHGSVKAPQSCFHMGEGQAHLCGGQGRCQGGIDVADHHHHVWVASPPSCVPVAA